MKNFYLLCIGLALLVGCKNKAVETKPQTAAQAGQEVVDIHHANNSLDYQGTYKGVLPAASTSGMEVTLVLGDNTYHKTVSYVGKKDKPVETSGNYTWDATGTIITLVGEELPNQYFVSENKLIHLDVDGKRITGDLANLYILKKQ